MEIDSATEDDLPALLPLLRGYCDFYESSPSDDGLMAMAEALIAAPDADGMLLVARDGDGVADRLRDRRLEVVEPAGRADRRHGGPVRGARGARPGGRRRPDPGLRRPGPRAWARRF